MITPAPSPSTKPSRSLSNGRLFLPGSRSPGDSARAWMNPARPIGVMPASDPPVSITSAWSYWIVRRASPIACAPLAQAVEMAVFGPLSPNSMERLPAAALTIILGTVKGLTRPGPPSMKRVCCSSNSQNPPMPEP